MTRPNTQEKTVTMLIGMMDTNEKARIPVSRPVNS